jgi:hypothetical protein
MRKPVTKFDKARLKEKVTMTDIDREDFENIDLDFFFNYMIFPSDIMSFMTQWKMEKRGMKIGDTILQQVFIPPVRIFSYKILFGVRINNIIDEVDRKGFSYETIEGHVEKGESTFLIERTENRLIFKIKTFSEPGNLLAKLAGSFFALPYQAYCTRRALKNVKKQIESPSVNA